MARQPDVQTAGPLTAANLPNRNNTLNQMAHIDNQIAALQDEDASTVNANADRYRSIWIFQNGVRQALMIDIVSLRLALQLPGINLNGLTTFDDVIQVRPEAGNVDDLDH
jgi:hypothetical protein